METASKKFDYALRPRARKGAVISTSSPGAVETHLKVMNREACIYKQASININ